MLRDESDSPVCTREIISGTILNIFFFFFLFSNYIHPLRSSISKSSNDRKVEEKEILQQ